MIELGVNIDHVATLRQARRTHEPDPIWAAVEAHLGGADGITVHLREDRRHIQDEDVRRLRELVHIKLNLEMAATEEMVGIACTLKPEMAMLVPEGRQIFPNLTVRENLVATAANRGGAAQPWDFAQIVELFPALGERLDNMGNQLSGGEQQMLAVGRALMTNPKLLILDEATEGLAPLIRQEIWRCLERLKALGLAILVIDKNVAALTRIAARHYIVEKGRVVWSGTSAALRADPALQHRHLGV